MWSFGAPIFNNVVSFFSASSTYETWNQKPIERLKNLYEDIEHIIDELRDRGDATSQDWVSTSGIIPKLNQIVDLVVEEEHEFEKNAKEEEVLEENTTPCRDYILQQQKIDELCGFAMADNPKGLTAIITQHLTKLFRDVHFPLFSHETIHVSISALVQKLKFYAGSNSLQSLGQTVVDFIEIVCEKLCDHPDFMDVFFLNTLSPKSPSEDSSVSFPLIEPIIPYLNDVSLGRQARKIIMMLVAFPRSDITFYLTSHVSVVPIIVENLVEALQQLHSNMLADEDIMKPPLVYISELLQLCKNTAEYKDNASISMQFYMHLLDTIESTVLRGFFEVELLHISNTRIRSATRLLTSILTFLSSSSPSSPFIERIIQFLFSSESLLLSTLISRINNHNPSVSILTLQLFNALLRTQHPLVLSSLLWSSLEMEGKQDEPIKESIDSFALFAACFKDELPKKVLGATSPSTEALKNMMNDIDFERVSIAEERMIQSDLSQKGVSTHFLKNLVSRIKMFLRQPMMVNLAVSQVITTLAIIVKPDLFALLFTDRHPLSITCVLSMIWEKAVERSKGVNGFEKYVRATETSLSMCDKSIGVQREDFLSTDVIFSQYLDGYIVLREFLTELSYAVKMRETPL